MGTPRAWLVHATFVLLAVGLCATYTVTTGVAHNGAVVLSSLIPAVVLSIQLVRSRRTGTRVAWWWLLGGLASFTAHNVDSLLAEVVRGEAASTSTFAMLSLLGGYLGLLVGSSMLTMPYLRQDAGGMIDSTIIGVAVASVVWEALLHPVAVARGDEAGEQLYRVLVVVLVSGLFGAVLRAAGTAREARASVAYHALAVTAGYVGVVAGALTKDTATGAEVWWVRLCWIVAYLALGAGAAHPSFVHLVAARRPDGARLSRQRLFFLGAALALNPLLAGLQVLLGRTPDPLLFSLGTLLLVPLVLARIAGLARAHADAESQLARLATHDELTDLPNRRAITAHLREAIGRLRAGASPGLVVLFCDLDDFKDVNDTHGHHLGDRLLVVVARRLRRAVRSDDLVGRFGGDEFVVVVEGRPSVVEPRVVATIADALRTPVTLADVVASAAVSIGSASALPGDDVTAEQLLSSADAAMYAAKRERQRAAAPDRTILG